MARKRDLKVMEAWRVVGTRTREKNAAQADAASQSGVSRRVVSRPGAAGCRSQRCRGQAQGQSSGPTQAAGCRANRDAVAFAGDWGLASRLCRPVGGCQADALCDRERVWRGVRPDAMEVAASRHGPSIAAGRKTLRGARPGGHLENDAASCSLMSASWPTIFRGLTGLAGRVCTAVTQGRERECN